MSKRLAAAVAAVFLAGAFVRGTGPTQRDPASARTGPIALPQSVDAVTVSGNRCGSGTGHAFAVPAGSVAKIDGWAYDPATKRPGMSIFARIDDGTWVRGSYGSQRPDVAAANADPALFAVGFSVSLSIAGVSGPGHRIGLAVMTDNDQYAYVAGSAASLSVRAVC